MEGVGEAQEERRKWKIFLTAERCNLDVTFKKGHRFFKRWPLTARAKAPRGQTNVKLFKASKETRYNIRG